MRVVITGATGNVGTSLLEALARDARITSVLGIARRMPEVSFPKTDIVAADVSESNLISLFEGADAVVHLAWQIQPGRDAALLERINVAGSRRVFEAVAQSGAKALIYASSVGAYGPRTGLQPVDESWPTTGIRSSRYSTQKAKVEHALDAIEQAHPELRVVRLRPALIFKREAGSEIRRYFLGPLVPRFPFRKRRVPLVPQVAGLVFQALHSSDVAEAYRLALVQDVRGAFNLAADPMLDADRLAQVLHAAKVGIPKALLRSLVWLSYRLHLQPTDPGWLDMGLELPLLDTTRAMTVLGWAPSISSTQALLELVNGIGSGAGLPTPPLRQASRSSSASLARRKRSSIASTSSLDNTCLARGNRSFSSSST